MTKAQVSQHKNNPIKSLLTVINQPSNQKNSLLSKRTNQ